MNPPPVQYAKTKDGFDIAYTVEGEGPPLILFPIRFSSVHTIWQHYPGLVSGLANRFRLVCFDARGEGFSSRGLREDTTMEDLDLDVEAVADHLGLERAVLLAFGSRGHHAIRYASRHPHRVEAMVLNTASIRNDTQPWSLWVGLPGEDWSQFLAELARNLSPLEQRRRIQDYVACIEPQDWAIKSRVIRASDVSRELSTLETPMLITHAADFVHLPLETSMRFAAAAPNSSLVVLDASSALANTTALLAAIEDFLKALPRQPEATSLSFTQHTEGISPREEEVLRLIAIGRSNQEIADELVVSLNTVRKHVSRILDKTGTSNRTEAAAYARDHGFV